MGAIVGIVFDIDDTLCLERHYVRSGFRAVSEYLHCPAAFDILWSSFVDGIRGNNFDRLLDERAELAAQTTVTELVRVYRNHAPDIALSEEVTDLLEALGSRGSRLGAISDGPVEAQAAKARALALYDRLDPIILTGQWGREFWKPHPRAYETIEEIWGLSPDSLVYVGDNPAKDFVTANERGWQTFRLRSHGQLHEDSEAPSQRHAPRHDVSSVSELSRMLRALA